MKSAPRIKLREVMQHRKEFIIIDDANTYKRCRVQLHAKGILVRDRLKGVDIRTKKQQLCREGDFLVAEIDAKMGGFGLVPAELDGAIVSSHYFLFEPIEGKLDRQYLHYFSRTEDFRNQVSAQGTTNYAAIRPGDVLGYEIPLPSLSNQKAIVAKLDALTEKGVQVDAHIDAIESAANALVLAMHHTLARGRIVPLSEVIELHEESVPILVEEAYPQVGVRSFGGGLFSKPAISSSETTYRSFNRLYPGAIVLSQVKGWEGAISLTPSSLVGMFVSPEYRTFRCVAGSASPEYLGEIFRAPWFWSLLQDATRGVGARRERTRPEQFINIILPMPRFEDQLQAAKLFSQLNKLRARQKAIREANASLLPAILMRLFA